MSSRNGHKETDTATTDHFAERAHEAVDSVAERAQRAEREVRGAATRTADQARRIRDEATERAEEHVQRATSYVESNPLALAGIAFVAGVLFSTLLRR
jgi:ElaB/YqjD/DUF883 family membrane-anchored ribosome-binding protein